MGRLKISNRSRLCREQKTADLKLNWLTMTVTFYSAEYRATVKARNVISKTPKRKACVTNHTLSRKKITLNLKFLICFVLVDTHCGNWHWLKNIRKYDLTRRTTKHVTLLVRLRSLVVPDRRTTVNVEACTMISNNI